MAGKRDYYEVLGVARAATGSEIEVPTLENKAILLMGFFLIIFFKFFFKKFLEEILLLLK